MKTLLSLQKAWIVNESIDLKVFPGKQEFIKATKSMLKFIQEPFVKWEFGILANRGVFTCSFAE